MATTVVGPSGGGDGIIASGGDITSELGSLLAEGYDGAGSEAPGGEGGEVGSPPVETPVETPAGEAPQPQLRTDGQPEAQPKPGEQPAAQPGDSPYPLSADGKTLLVPKTDFPALQAAQQFHQAVSQWFATPQEANAAYLQASDHRVMMNDYLHGSPEGWKSVLNHLAGNNHQDPRGRAQYQQNFAEMAKIMPETLKSVNPQAYEGLVNGMVGKAIELAYARAATTGNPEDFKRAQELDWGATGQYKTELPKVDREAQERQQFEQQRQQFADRQRTAENRDAAAFNQAAVEGAKFIQLNTEIDKILAPVKARYSDIAYADLKEGIKRELVDTLKKSPEWWLEHEQNFHGLIQDYRQTWRSGQPGAGLQPRVQAYISDFLSKARRALPSIAQKRIEGTKRPVGRPVGPKPAGPPANAAPASNAPAPNGRVSSDQFDKEWAEVWKMPA